MKQYFTGFFTGTCLVASAVMFMGASSKNLGDITVNSITVKDNGAGGFIRTYNPDGKKTVYLGTGEGGIGFLKTFNADGIETAYIGTGEGGDGGMLTTSSANGKKTAYLGDSNLQIYNNHGVKVGYFGENTYGDGIAALFDRYGDTGWSASGKQ